MTFDYSFTAEEIEDMRGAQTGHMLDECVVLAYTLGALNEFNEADAPVYISSDPVLCGLEMRPGSRRFGEEMTVIQYDAALRMPLDTPIKETDRIQVVGRFSEFHEFPTYEIVSPIQRGPSGVRVYLRKVVT